ncbi:MAG: ADP-ribosylglycohydrolase family protein [Pseudomonadota bacterium]
MAIVPTPISKPLAESYWVIPGRLLAGKYPGGKTPKEAERRVGALLEAGFDTFIDLTVAGELPPYDIYLPATVRYTRKPIPDHGVPTFPEHMAEIQAEIDTALKRGGRVYVHCRAGIGRTGIAVACHLVKQGMPPDAALIRLNELWQDNERSATWPDVPETDEQRDYILAWSPHSDPMQAPEVMDAARTLRERFQGALVGLAVGDALAAHTQFRKPGTFAAVGDLLGGGPFDQPRGAWTDDTAMALLLAESLLEREGFDAHDQVQRYARWQREGYGSATGQCVGISANVARALATAQYKRQPFAGSHDPEQLDKDPLSRVAPAVMYFFADVSTAVAKAAEAARITAQAPLVLDCVRMLAAMVHVALSGRDKSEVLRPSRALWLTASTRPELLAVYDGSYNNRQPPEITGGGGILQALEAALWAFQNSETFRQGALLAANLGRDSDVVAAAYGQVAGAYHGVSAIPGIWRNSLIRQEVIIDSADRLLTHALVALGT